ncbi:MAG: SDR family NAD(P)-dependent oxidoreductase [Pseudomonadota bacterium]
MIAGRHALVIGASGGIGRALADAIDRIDDVDLVLRAGRSAAPGMDVTIDLADEDSIAAAAETVAERTGRLHLLIVATGILHEEGVSPEKRLEDLAAPSLARLMAVNAIGPILVARHFLPLLKHRERACFAAISARVGSIGDNRLGGWYGYRASKAALNMYLRTLAVEARRRARNLICVGLHPGTVDTSLSAPFQGNVPEGKLFSPEQSAGYLLQVLEGVGPEESGRIFAWDGQPIEW